MKLNFALSLSFEGIQLLRRMQDGWAVIDEVALDTDDLDAAMRGLKDTACGLHPNAYRLGLIIPNEQIRYLSIPAPARDAGPDVLEKTIKTALDGATPYAVSELVYDHAVSGGTLHIAAVARETLDEAEGFAHGHGFTPQAHLAIAPDGAFSAPVFFGAASDWTGQDPQRPRQPIEVIPATPDALTPTALALNVAAKGAGQDSPEPAKAPDAVPGPSTASDPEANPDTPETPVAAPASRPAEPEPEPAPAPSTAKPDTGVAPVAAPYADRNRKADEILGETGTEAPASPAPTTDDDGTTPPATGQDLADRTVATPDGPSDGSAPEADAAPAMDPVLPEPAKPEAAKPEATKPEAARPETAKPETGLKTDPLPDPEVSKSADIAPEQSAPEPEAEQLSFEETYEATPPPVSLPGSPRLPRDLVRDRTGAAAPDDARPAAPPEDKTGRGPDMADLPEPDPKTPAPDLPKSPAPEAKTGTPEAMAGTPEAKATDPKAKDAEPKAAAPIPKAPEPQARPDKEPDPAPRPAFSTIRATREAGRDGAIPRAPRPFRLGAARDADKSDDTDRAKGGIVSGAIAPTADHRTPPLTRNSGLFSDDSDAPPPADPRAEAPPPPARAPVNPPHPAFALRQRVAEQTKAAEAKSGRARPAAPKAPGRPRVEVSPGPATPRAKPPLAAKTKPGPLAAKTKAKVKPGTLSSENRAALRPGAAGDTEAAFDNPAGGPGPGPSLAAGDAAIASFADATRDERERLTVFGERGRDRIGGKPRFLGLMLTAGLLIFLAGVAAWASVFLDDGLARFFRSEPETQAIAALPEVEAAPAPVLSQPDPAPAEAEATPDPAPPDPDSATATVQADNETDVEAEADEDARLAALETGTDAAPSGLSTPTPLRALTNEEAAATYAATGIWQRAPAAPLNLPTGDVDDVYVASIDPDVQQFDAVALPEAADIAPEGALADPGLPPPAGMVFDFDERGLVRATPEGALSPEGLRIFTGQPPAVPPLRNPPPPGTITAPDGSVDDARLGPGTDPALGGLRPEARPSDLVEQFERVELKGVSLSELAEIRPVLRPRTAQEEAAVEAPDATEQAIIRSLLPVTRPRNMQTIVERAEAQARANPAPVQTASAATAGAPRVVQPRLPSSASVSRTATIRNAINLKQINLIGVYGTQSNRRALVRMSNGRYIKVKVGDQLDGGQVQAINASELRYRKGNRTLTLEMPRG